MKKKKKSTTENTCESTFVTRKRSQPSIISARPKPNPPSQNVHQASAPALVQYSANMMPSYPRRIKLQAPSQKFQTKLVLVPGSIPDLIAITKSKFKFDVDASIVFRVDEAEIDDVAVLRDNDLVWVLVNGEMPPPRGGPGHPVPPMYPPGYPRPGPPMQQRAVGTNKPPPAATKKDGAAASSTGAAPNIYISPYAVPHKGYPPLPLTGRLVPKRSRVRRKQSELVRHFKCPVEGCGKEYASDNSLQQHIRIKHPNYVQPPKNNSNKNGDNSDGEDEASSMSVLEDDKETGTATATET